MLTSDYFPITQQLYLAYLGRPADPDGLTAFASQLQAAGAPTDLAGLNTAYYQSPAIKSLVDSLGKSAEAAALYGSGDLVSFVTEIYENMLGRGPRFEGLLFWTDEIATGRLTRAEAPITIMAAAFSNTSNPALARVDQQTLNNKLGAAQNFTDILVKFDAAGLYEGRSAAADGRAMLRAVSDQTSPAQFQDRIEGMVWNMMHPHMQFHYPKYPATPSDDWIILDHFVQAYGLDGSDTFLISSMETSASAFPGIYDFMPGEKIVFRDAGDYARATLGPKITVDASVRFADFLNAAAAGSTPGDLRWFTYMGNTFVLNDASASSSYQAGADQIVRLVGMYDLSAGTLSDSGMLTHIVL